MIQAALNLTSAVLASAWWWLVAVLALARATGGMLGAALTRRISATVLRYGW